MSGKPYALSFQAIRSMCAGALAAAPLAAWNPDFTRSIADALLCGSTVAALGMLVASLWRAPRSGLLFGVGFALSSAAAIPIAHPIHAWLGPERPDGQVILIGLDGADWKIIDALREEGRLPTLDRLVRTGARGTLDTLVPSVSPSIWTSIASGMRPEQHGVVDFWTSSPKVRSKRIWEIIDERGGISGVLGYLVTWPPKKNSGFLIPGWLAQDRRTWPPELSFAKELEAVASPALRENQRGGGESSSASLLSQVGAAVRYGLTVQTLRAGLRTLAMQLRGADHGALDISRRLALVEFKTDLFCHLLRTAPPDLGIFYHRHIDATGHVYFKYYKPDGFPSVTTEEVASYGDAIPRFYEVSDESVSRIQRCASPTATLLVVSDHGQESVGLEFSQVRIKGRALLEKLDLESQLRATSITGRLFLRPTSAEVDFPAALALVRSVVDETDHSPAFRVERRRNIGALVTPVLKWKSDRTLRIAGRVVTMDELMTRTEHHSGKHTPNAIFLITGPDIAQGTLLQRGHILDIAPTVLGLLGHPIADDMEGHFRGDALVDEARARLTLTTVTTYGSPNSGPHGGEELNKETLQRLEKLGYIE